MQRERLVVGRRRHRLLELQRRRHRRLLELQRRRGVGGVRARGGSGEVGGARGAIALSPLSPGRGCVGGGKGRRRRLEAADDLGCRRSARSRWGPAGQERADAVGVPKSKIWGEKEEEWWDPLVGKQNRETAGANCV
jgi:hypothetical protein